MKKTIPKTVGAWKHFLLGGRKHDGLLKTILFYFIMCCISFIFLYPLLGAIITSLMSVGDLVDPSVTWLPTEWYMGNYAQAMKILDFWTSFFHSMLMSLVPAILQTAATAVIGFGLARFKFPGKKLMLILVIATFLIPQQVTLIPRYLLFDKWNLLDNVFSVFLPSVTGQGLYSTIFILVFMQYFSSYPVALDEAAELDGAGQWRIFLKIGIPMARSAIVMSVLFSFVWYWNETQQANLLFGGAYHTLPMMLQQFNSRYEAMYGADVSGGITTANTAISMAGTLLSILPVLLLYIFMQKQFVESIERSGITGE